MANKNKTDLMVTSLGGLGVVGMNCYVIEYLDNIFVMDAGILFTNGDIPGVDYVIPDFTYLIENQEKIKALFFNLGNINILSFWRGEIIFIISEVIF